MDLPPLTWCPEGLEDTPLREVLGEVPEDDCGELLAPLGSLFGAVSTPETPGKRLRFLRAFLVFALPRLGRLQLVALAPVRNYLPGGHELCAAGLVRNVATLLRLLGRIGSEKHGKRWKRARILAPKVCRRLGTGAWAAGGAGAALLRAAAACRGRHTTLLGHETGPGGVLGGASRDL